jgi:hypothetical protein
LKSYVSGQDITVLEAPLSRTINPGCDENSKLLVHTGRKGNKIPSSRKPIHQDQIVEAIKFYVDATLLELDSHLLGTN